MSVNRLQERSSARTTCPVVVVDKHYAGGVAEDAAVDIQPITRVDFVPAKVFRSRSMNTRAVIFRLGASCFIPVVFARCASPSQ